MAGEVWPYVIERLARDHDRETFKCGKPDLDQYFRERVRQDERGKVAAACVAVADDGTVAGFYTLSSWSVPTRDFPPGIAGKLPGYPALPTTLIGRLAVDTRHQGRRLGEFLLMDALKRSLAESERVGSWAVFVEAIDAEAADFYRKYGFEPLPDQPLRLFVPMRTIAKLA